MKKTIIYLMQLLLLIYIIMFRFVITRYFLNYVDLFNIVFFGMLSLMAYFTLGFSKKSSLKDYSAIQTIIICYIFYYIITYLLGLLFGFVSTFYSLKILNIIKRIVTVSLFYALKEMYRYMAIKSMHKEKRFYIVLITLLLISLDIIMEINVNNFKNIKSIFEFIEISVIPNIALNLILSYLAYNFNYKTIILFILFTKLPNYFMPIFPDLGNYFGTIIKVLFYFYCYYQLSYIIERWEKRERKFKKIGKRLSFLILIMPLLILVILVSGLFKYHLFAIGSNSMVPVLSRGDAVLVEKIQDEELEKLKNGDIIAFNYGERMLVHRIVSIEKNGEKYIIKTKGDNNTSIDAWNVNNDMVYGKVIYYIKYIGIPSVQLSELLNK